MTYPDWQTLRNHAIEQFGETPHPATEQDIIDAYEHHPDVIAKAVDNIGHEVATGAARSGWGVLRARANTIQHAPSNPTRATGVTREKMIARAEQWIRNAGCHYDRETEIQDELFGDRGLLHEYAQYDGSTDATPPNQTPLRLRQLPGDVQERGSDARTPAVPPLPDRERAGGTRTSHLVPDRARGVASGTITGDTQLVDRMLETWRTARPAGERVEQELDERGRRWIAHQAKLQQMAAAKAAELEAAASALAAPDLTPTTEKVPF